MPDINWESFALSSVLASAALALAYLYSTWTYNTFKKRGIPGPRPWPLIGNTAEIFRKPIPNIDLDYISKYGKVFGVYYGRTPVLFVADLDLLKEITMREFAHFTNHSTRDVRYPKPFDRMVTVIRDDHWKHVRSMLSPTFTSGKLKQMLPAIMDCSDNLLDHIGSACDRIFDVKNLMSAYTMDVIAGTAFGLKTDSLSDDSHPFLRHAQHFFEAATKPTPKIYVMLAILLVLPKLGELLMKVGVSIFDREAVDYIERVVQRALEQRQLIESHASPMSSAAALAAADSQASQHASPARKDFLQSCVDHHVEVDPADRESLRITNGLSWTTKGLTMGDIMSNAVLFIVAGYETTANLLTYFCFSMATWPEVQERVIKEIDEKLCGAERPTYDNLAQLTYLDQCLHEVLRMYPPASRLDRECSQDSLINGIQIKRGMVVGIPVHAIHYDADIWPNPYEFRPERFDVSECEKRHPCAWMPFGLGLRNCIGMRLALLEAKVAAARLLQAYRVDRTEETPTHPLKWKAMSGMLLPDQPIKLRYLKR